MFCKCNSSLNWITDTDETLTDTDEALTDTDETLTDTDETLTDTDETQLHYTTWGCIWKTVIPGNKLPEGNNMYFWLLIPQHRCVGNPAWYQAK